MPQELPSYQPRLAAFHKAFGAELRAIIRSLPLHPHMRVLDVGCGDGYYTGLIAERLETPGSVTGLDSNQAYIELAKDTFKGRTDRCEVQFVEGKIEEISAQPPWDLVWCAQSLYSLPEPVQALRAMARVTRPGGMVVVLENDSLHELLLPWPIELELGLRVAEHAELSEQSMHPAKYYVGRRLPAVFSEAGLEPLFFRTQCIDRQAPLDSELRDFLELYLVDLIEGTQRKLSQGMRNSLQALIDPASSGHVLKQPHFTMSWLNVLAWGCRRLSSPPD